VRGMAQDVSRGLGGGRAAAWLSSAALLTAALVVFSDRLVSAARSDLLAYDFRQTFLPAAEALLDGRSPYPEYGYPPLVAFLSVPFALLPSPEFVLTAVLIACVPLSLWLLGVRDWRCYVAVFLWVSVFNAVQTANVSLLLLLAGSACWRWRDHLGRASLAGGLAVASKIVAWPLALWLAATRRLVAAGLLFVVAAGVTLGLWATIGFSGLRTYPESLDRLQEKESSNGYTLQAFASDLGLSGSLSTALAVAVAVLVLAAVVIYGRRGDDPRSFACAMIAVIFASPIVWLHSFALLVAPVAVLRPRLAWVWLLPAVLWFVSPGTGNGAPWQTALTLGVAAVVVMEALRPSASTASGWSARGRKPMEAT
jgi:hypothetical protein